jgi:hypothetical protein
MLAAMANGRTVGVLPLVVMRSRLFGRFVVSLPFLNEAGVLADDGPAEAALIDSAVRVTKQDPPPARVRTLLPAGPDCAQQHLVVEEQATQARKGSQQWFGHAISPAPARRWQR